VREEIPDVRAKRPEISAALASIVDTATAKHLEDRYADDVELISDLEELLTLETQRAGSLTGEATTVMRSLPRGTRRRVPFRVRHRSLTTLAAAVLVLVVAGVGVWLITRAHHGTPNANQPSPGRTVQVSICNTCAEAYNPDGIGGIAQDNSESGLAIDGDPNTAWTTQNYYTGQLGKPGVGIYVSAPYTDRIAAPTRPASRTAAGGHSAVQLVSGAARRSLSRAMGSATRTSSFGSRNFRRTGSTPRSTRSCSTGSPHPFLVVLLQG
jgi:hypothetical protein